MSSRALTTEPGFVNRNRQKVKRRATWMDSGRDNQYLYVMECQVGGCHHEYGTDGISVHQRRCPRCQDGKPGLPVPAEAPGLFDGIW